MEKRKLLSLKKKYGNVNISLEDGSISELKEEEAPELAKV